MKYTALIVVVTSMLGVAFYAPASTTFECKKGALVTDPPGVIKVGIDANEASTGVVRIRDIGAGRCCDDIVFQIRIVGTPDERPLPVADWPFFKLKVKYVIMCGEDIASIGEIDSGVMAIGDGGLANYMEFALGVDADPFTPDLGLGFALGCGCRFIGELHFAWVDFSQYVDPFEPAYMYLPVPPTPVTFEINCTNEICF